MADMADLIGFWVRCHFEAGNGIVASGLLLEINEDTDEPTYVVIYRDELRDTLETQERWLWIAPEDQSEIRGDVWVPEQRMLRYELVPIS